MGVTFEQVTARFRDGNRITVALDLLDVRFSSGRMTALLGAPGSGKSTLLQHLNGLLRPDEGRMRTFEYELGPGKPGEVPPALRRKAGIVFQYPEQQLFAATVREELLYAPLNFGMDESGAARAAEEAARALGVFDLMDESPLELSSGQQRKVAIAAVLAADPDLLALDEPTASLDPESRTEMMELLARLCRQRGKTVITITHRLEDVLGRADECVVLSGGKRLFQGTPEQLIGRPDVMEAAGLAPPPAARLAAMLAEKWGTTPPSLYGAEELAAWAIRMARQSGGERT